MASHAAIAAFFARCGLPPETRETCIDRVRCDYPSSTVNPDGPQGYCSFTVYVDDDRVVQFRPAAHRLDVALGAEARRIFGDLAPRLTVLGKICFTDTALLDEGKAGLQESNDRPGITLDIYELSLIHGASLASFLAPTGSAQSLPSRDFLLADFAHFLSLSYTHRLAPTDPALPGLKRLVGRSLHQRTSLMSTQLPSRFRPLAAHLLAALPRIESLPWVLTHGDVVPANVMVAPRRRSRRNCRPADPPRLAGLIDWAEAEYLPFGVGLYGLEDLLLAAAAAAAAATAAPPSPADGGAATSSSSAAFAYAPDAAHLRAVFRDELRSAVPALREDAAFAETVGLAHRLGVLLWHGIAFDDGRLDRVVEEGRDDEEIRRLDLFFFGAEGKVRELGQHGDGHADVAVGGQEQSPGFAMRSIKRLWESLRGVRVPGLVFGKL